MAKDRNRALEVDILEDINTYLETVSALLCLGSFLTWDGKANQRMKGASFFLGRRMQTGPNNSQLKNGKVTPDLVVTATPKHGILAEAKASFGGSVVDRMDDLKQLMKYDDDLKGWPTPNEEIENHDIALLVHYTRKSDAKDVLDEATKTGVLKVKRKMAGVTFLRMQQVDEQMVLEHFWGDWTDPGIKRQLGPLSLKLETVLPNSSVYLYDSFPPIPFLIHLAWSNVFSQLIPVEGYGTKDLQLECTIEQVRDKLSETCTHRESQNKHRQPEIPQKAWVEKMMEVLVSLELAQVLDKNEGRYKVFFKKRTLDQFIRSYVKLTSKESRRSKGRKRGRRSDDQPGQMTIFGGN